LPNAIAGRRRRAAASARHLKIKIASASRARKSRVLPRLCVRIVFLGSLIRLKSDVERVIFATLRSGHERSSSSARKKRTSQHAGHDDDRHIRLDSRPGRPRKGAI
jgi:hypothetical protein